MLKTYGIHHISSIVGHAQRNIDFYAGVLGMRLVKQTLNFDDSSTYHLYFGNHDGSESLMTTFPWNDAKEGVIGAGQVGITSYGVNPATLEFWRNRLEKFKIKHFAYTRFNIKRLAFEDPDGLQYELVETNQGINNNWEFNGVSAFESIKGINNAILYSRVPHATLDLLENVFGYKIVDEDDENYRLQVNDDFGGTLELSKKEVTQGQMGVGMVHHIALKINENDIEAWRQKLVEAGFRPTAIKNRKYFKSLYFREKGGILFELATEKPGVLVDETVNSLGKQLLIPPHFEEISEEIVETLMPIEVREVSELVGYGYRDRYEFEILRRKNKIKTEILNLKVLQHEGKITEAQLAQLEALKVELRNVK